LAHAVVPSPHLSYRGSAGTQPDRSIAAGDARWGRGTYHAVPSCCRASRSPAASVLSNLNVSVSMCVARMVENVMLSNSPSGCMCV
jgi:hypothetical protein